MAIPAWASHSPRTRLRPDVLCRQLAHWRHVDGELVHAIHAESGVDALLVVLAQGAGARADGLGGQVQVLSGAPDVDGDHLV